MRDMSARRHSNATVSDASSAIRSSQFDTPPPAEAAAAAAFSPEQKEAEVKGMDEEDRLIEDLGKTVEVERRRKFAQKWDENGA